MNHNVVSSRNGSKNEGGIDYIIPPEVLKDKKFSNMINEAQKYIGYSYIWGGSTPETGFDCSGFVCWVLNHCENGWHFARCNAEELCSKCEKIAPEDSKPGDLIFFEKTYDKAGATHVGIYCGNNIMLHCGNPIQYANINIEYWQSHFLCFGRFPLDEDHIGMRVHSIQKKDYLQLHALYTQLDEKEPDMEKMVHVFESVKNDPHYTVFGIYNDKDLLCGTTTLSKCLDLTGDASFYYNMENFVIDEKYQNKGYGKYLLRYVEDYARGHNGRYISFTSSNTRSNAHLFYSHMGYIQDIAKGFKKKL